MSFEVLKRSILSKKLGAFYILDGEIDESLEGVKKFFATTFLPHKTNPLSALENHADFLVINKKEEKNYTLDEISAVFSFLSHRALELDQKFVIVDKAHLINDIVANKLLKVLEDPAIKVTFFLLNPKSATLLPTINSRALTLHWAKQETFDNDFKEVFEKAGELDFHEFSEYLKKKKISERNLYEQTLLWPKLQNANAKTVNELLEFIQHFNDVRVFHGADRPRLVSWFELIKTVM